MARGLRERADAAGGAHDEGLGEPGLPTAVGERPEVAGEHGPEVGVDRRRRGALVLPELRSDLVRGDDVRVRQPAAKLLRDAPLVGRVAEGEEQADRHRLRLDLGQRVEVERLDHACRADPLAHADAALQRDEGLRVPIAEAVQVRPGLTAQVQEVLEAGRADEGRPRALPLEQRVRGDRRPVREPLQRSVAAPTCGRGLDNRAPPARGAVGTLAVRSSPPARRTASVKVPPTSIPRIATAHV